MQPPRANCSSVHAWRIERLTVMARRFAPPGSDDSDAVQGPSRVSDPADAASHVKMRSPRRRVVASSGSVPKQLDRREGFTRRADCGEMEADRAVLTRKQEEMRHPPEIWVDPSYAEEE